MNIEKQPQPTLKKFKDIKENSCEDCWVSWIKRYIEYNKTGKAVTFVVLIDGDLIGKITVLFSPECSAVKNRPMLCNGKDRASMNTFRIEKRFEGQGHVSRLVKMAEEYKRKRREGSYNRTRSKGNQNPGNLSSLWLYNIYNKH